MPMWSLLMSVALSNLEDTRRQFGFYRVWGAVGWIAAGVLVSLLKIDQSPMTGQLAAGSGCIRSPTCTTWVMRSFAQAWPTRCWTSTD